MAVMRVVDFKRVGVKSISSDMEKQEIGWKDQCGKLYFNSEDVAIVSKHFDLLYQNRIQFLAKVKNVQKAMPQYDDVPSFKP